MIVDQCLARLATARGVPGFGGFLSEGLRRDWSMNVELAVKMMAQQPEEALVVVEFYAEAFGFLARGRGEARGGDDNPLGEFTLGDGADDLPDGGDINLVVRCVRLAVWRRGRRRRASC